jgi:hypothetical protein
MYIDNRTHHHYPSEPLRLCSRKLIQNFVFRSCDFVYCRTSSPFALLRTSSPFALHTSSPVALCRAALHPIAPHRSSPLLIASHRVKSDSFGNPPYTYIFSLFSHSSHRLLKKGLTSTCTFLTFCRFILLQAYQCDTSISGYLCQPQVQYMSSQSMDNGVIS